MNIDLSSVRSNGTTKHAASSGSSLDARIAALKKKMVDLFADENLYHFFQGSELINIYEKILERYSINFTKLFSYAKRRKKEQEIKQFMNNHIPNILEDIIND